MLEIAVGCWEEYRKSFCAKLELLAFRFEVLGSCSGFYLQVYYYSPSVHLNEFALVLFKVYSVRSFSTITLLQQLRYLPKIVNFRLKIKNSYPVCCFGMISKVLARKLNYAVEMELQNFSFCTSDCNLQ